MMVYKLRTEQQVLINILQKQQKTLLVYMRVMEKILVSIHLGPLCYLVGSFFSPFCFFWRLKLVPQKKVQNGLLIKFIQMFILVPFFKDSKLHGDEIS